MKLYKIVTREKHDNAWKDEKFLTGGREFISYKEAQNIKRKIQKMCSSILYKVIPI